MQRQLSLSGLSGGISMQRQLLQLNGAAAGEAALAADEETKAEKPARPSGKERAIHLIPLLTFFCFLLLFLCSHDPSSPSSSDLLSSGGGGSEQHGNRKLRTF